MPTLEENRETFTRYAWDQSGEEWSVVWGGTENLWWGALYPRLRFFLPARTILEIAPGYGRMTRYLKDFGDRLILVDMLDRCIAACRERFAEERHVEYHVNDGLSLHMVPDNTVDFAFSFDSLVHADDDVLRAYLAQLVHKLSPRGVAFLHHSNVGAFVDASSGRLAIENRHWRSEKTTAALARTLSAEVGLRCFLQELVNWGSEHLTDCFSCFTRQGSPWDQAYRLRQNPEFMTAARELGAIGRHYASAPPAAS